ncbi:MAG TPA: ABC transporter substrate-binding protein [Methylomirabilota bacterium]|jgi:branched-chain amino acid transport system substrate-binding protein|nr:ABC transporter substrate-binding protein [Methylomirabilota bacterium]
MLTRRPLVLVLALAALALMARPASAQPKEVVVGIIYPMSGPSASAGVDDKHVFELFADMVNGKEPMLPAPFYQKLKGLPGVGGGARVRLVFADHQGKPDVGQSEAERLITQERVHALLGSWHSSVTATTSQVAERFGIPHMNSESASPGLTRRGFKWFFRTSPTDEHFSQAQFDFLADLQKKKGVKIESVAITHEDTLFGTDSGKVQRGLAQKYGYKIVADFPYRATSTTLSSEVQKLKAANPDVWLPTSYTSDAVLFLRTAKELDWNPKMVLTQDAGHIDPKFIEQSGKDSEGYLSRSPFASDLIDKNPLAKALNGPYKARSGKDLYDFPARAVTGFVALLDAINRAGSTDPEAIRRALAVTDIKPADLIMPWTGVKFDETGQNIGVRAIVMQLQGGKYYTVWPFDMATRDVIYPIPRWSERR